MSKIVFSTLLLQLSFLFSQNSKAIDNTITNYFPLMEGNFYVYDYLLIMNWDTTIHTKIKAEINVSSNIFGRLYHYCTFFPRFSNVWLRTDTLTGSLYKFDSTGSCPNYYYEKAVDSLSANIGDSILSCGMIPFGAVCLNIRNVNIFGQIFEEKDFSYYVSNSSGFSWLLWGYLKNIGPVGSHYHAETIYYTSDESYSLLGCMINGIVYSDTSTVNIKTISNRIPPDFKLLQNYPNPFNPSTNIRFEIPRSSLVKLIVYDILGREVATLVNEKLSAGSFEVSWNGAGYPSGVYFYKLITDDFINVRKMVLIK